MVFKITFLKLNGNDNTMKQFDSIVIGTGQSGPSLAARLAGEGRSVAIVERKLLGGLV